MSHLLKITCGFIEKVGWKNFSIDALLKETGLNSQECMDSFNSKESFLNFLIKDIRSKAMQLLDKDSSLSEEEILFDLIMSCLESASNYKGAIRLIIPIAECDISEILNVVKTLPNKDYRVTILNSLSWLLEKSGYDTDGFIGQLKVRIFGLLFLRIVFVWLQDNSDNLGKTLIEVDKIINKYAIYVLHPENIINS